MIGVLCSSSAQFATQNASVHLRECPDEFGLSSVVMVSQNDPQASESRPVNARMPSLQFNGTTRRCLADDLKKPLSGAKKDVFVHSCGETRLNDAI